MCCVPFVNGEKDHIQYSTLKFSFLEVFIQLFCSVYANCTFYFITYFFFFLFHSVKVEFKVFLGPAKDLILLYSTVPVDSRKTFKNSKEIFGVMKNRAVWDFGTGPRVKLIDKRVEAI